jgi:uncharacterized membrane protein YgaE (UPF0421/DUF939 family)
MRLLQLVVVGAVLSSNVYWQWTPNGYLATLIGIFAAIIVSAFIVAVQKSLNRTATAALSQERRDQGR